MDSAQILNDLKAQLAAKLAAEPTETDLIGLQAGLDVAPQRRPIFSRNALGVLAAGRWKTAYELGVANAPRYSEACAKEAWG